MGGAVSYVELVTPRDPSGAIERIALEAVAIPPLLGVVLLPRVGGGHVARVGRSLHDGPVVMRVVGRGPLGWGVTDVLVPSTSLVAVFVSERLAEPEAGAIELRVGGASEPCWRVQRVDGAWREVSQTEARALADAARVTVTEESLDAIEAAHVQARVELCGGYRSAG